MQAGWETGIDALELILAGAVKFSVKIEFVSAQLFEVAATCSSLKE